MSSGRKIAPIKRGRVTTLRRSREINRLRMNFIENCVFRQTLYVYYVNGTRRTQQISQMSKFAYKILYGRTRLCWENAYIFVIYSSRYYYTSHTLLYGKWHGSFLRFSVPSIWYYISLEHIVFAENLYCYILYLARI